MAKRIALYISALRKGGAERVLVNLADYLAENGYLVTMVTQYKKENEYPLNPKVKRVISDITEEETTGSRVVNFKRRFMKLRNIWKKERPEVILSFIGKNNILAILTSFGLGIPVAVSVRSEPAREYYNGWMRFLAKNLFALADGVILQTKECFSFFPERVKKKAVILRNPINSSFFRERYVGERDKTIVTVGRVDQNKNHQMLINAFAEIAQEYPDYQLIIYGDGNQRETLLKLVEGMDLQERILLPGRAIPPFYPWALWARALLPPRWPRVCFEPFAVLLPPSWRGGRSGGRVPFCRTCAGRRGSRCRCCGSFP